MPRTPNATQEFVPIKNIEDGVITLKDGSLRSILLCSSVNFALKSEEEKEATLFQFQDFINSLDFSIEIVVQSRKLDIRPYVALLEERQKEQTNELMKIQVREYIDFVKSFTETTNIMTKSFFIVVPYGPTILKSGSKNGFASRLGLSAKKKGQDTENSFDENRSQLEERLLVVEQGLVRTGIRVAHLGTEEVIELFYKAFNPGETEKPIQLK